MVSKTEPFSPFYAPEILSALKLLLLVYKEPVYVQCWRYSLDSNLIFGHLGVQICEGPKIAPTILDW